MLVELGVSESSHCETSRRPRAHEETAPSQMLMRHRDWFCRSRYGRLEPQTPAKSDSTSLCCPFGTTHVCFFRVNFFKIFKLEVTPPPEPPLFPTLDPSPGCCRDRFELKAVVSHWSLDERGLCARRPSGERVPSMLMSVSHRRSLRCRLDTVPRLREFHPINREVELCGACVTCDVSQFMDMASTCRGVTDNIFSLKLLFCHVTLSDSSRASIVIKDHLDTRGAQGLLCAPILI